MSPLKQLMDRFGPVGGKVLLIGAPVAVVAAFVARGRGGSAGGLDGSAPVAVGGGVGPDAIADLQNQSAEMFSQLHDEIGILGQLFSGGYTLAPTAPNPTAPNPAPAAPATGDVSPAPAPATATSVTVAQPIATQRERHRAAVAEIVASNAEDAVGSLSATRTAQGGMRTVIHSPDPNRRTVVTTPSNKAVAERERRQRDVVQPLREQARANVERELAGKNVSAATRGYRVNREHHRLLLAERTKS